MPKESKKSNSSGETPYSADTGSRVCVNNKRLDDFDQEKDLWGESRCPICLDHPHNAVLLLCSSLGCRPFMCHTTNLLSNCFYEFCISQSVTPSASSGNFADPLSCPLCRGELTGWEPARESMDKLVRNCSRDRFEFSGNYAGLMKHAEEGHPAARPGEVGENDVEEDDFDETDDYDELDEIDDFGLEEGEEDAYEGVGVSVRPGETFLDHIHFGGPDAQILSEEWSVSNGFVYYQRITTSGTYFYSGLVGETNIDDLRAIL